MIYGNILFEHSVSKYEQSSVYFRVIHRSWMTIVTITELNNIIDKVPTIPFIKNFSKNPEYDLVLTLSAVGQFYIFRHDFHCLCGETDGKYNILA